MFNKLRLYVNLEPKRNITRLLKVQADANKLITDMLGTRLGLKAGKLY